MREELAQLRVRLVGQHQVVERERRRDERCQPLERMLGLPSRGRPHEVAVDRPSRPRRVEPHPLQHRRDVALGEREARGELARQLLQLGPDGGAGAAAGIHRGKPRVPERCPFGMCRSRQLDRIGAGRVLAGPAPHEQRPVRPPSSRARRSRPPARRAPRRRAARAASARLRSGRGRSARGRRPPPPPRRPRDGRFPPGRARAPRSGRRAAGRRAPCTAPASRAGAATGARRGVGASPSRNCRAAAVRRSGPAAPAAGSTTPAATSVPRSSSADGDGDPEGLEHQPQQAGGHVAPRAVVVRAAEQRSRTGDRPPPTRRRRPRAPRRASARGDRAGARADRPPAAATRAAPRPLRRGRGRAPAGYRPRRRSWPPRRRSPDRAGPAHSARSCSRYTANAIRSTSRSSRSSEPSVTPPPRRTSRARRPCRRAARSRPAPPRRRPGS